MKRFVFIPLFFLFAFCGPILATNGAKCHLTMDAADFQKSLSAELDLRIGRLRSVVFESVRREQRVSAINEIALTESEYWSLIGKLIAYEEMKAYLQKFN